MISLGSRPKIVRNVRITGPSARYVPFTGLVDLVLADGDVVDVSPPGVLRTTGETWDAEGRWVVPGFWDHHVHLAPWALQSMRTDLRGASNADEAATLVSRSRPDARGIRIGIGYRDALWPHDPAAYDIDQLTGDVPTYLVNADLHSVWINSAAARRSQVSGPGIYREQDAFAIHSELDQLPAAQLDLAVAEAADAAASRGVVGIVDFDMSDNLTAWRRRAASHFDALRVSFGVYPADFDRALQAGLVTGDEVDGAGLIRVGPLKIITDGSLGTGTAACEHPYAPDGDAGTLSVGGDELRELLTRATVAGWEVAVHAIGDRAVRAALDAFTYTGAVGSLEHAQLVSHADLVRFGRLNVAASVQPSHALDDRDIVDRDWASQTGLAYPLRSLANAGATIVFGSDAPVAALDPWGTIADAVARTRDGRDIWRGSEAIDVTTAMAASTGLGTTGDVLIGPGSLADLAFCDADPFAADAQTLRAMRVGATMVAGRITHLG